MFCLIIISVVIEIICGYYLICTFNIYIYNTLKIGIFHVVK